MADDRCRDCNLPIRKVRLGTYKGVQFPVDFRPTPQGEYAVLGPDTAAYVKYDERTKFIGSLYTDHRRTCPANKGEPAKPLFPKIRIVCDACSAEHQIVDDETAREIAGKFISEHAACRRKAS